MNCGPVTAGTEWLTSCVGVSECLFRGKVGGVGVYKFGILMSGKLGGGGWEV